jgi:hypothetical protein
MRPVSAPISLLARAARRPGKHACASLIIGLLAFAVVQLGLIVVIDRSLPLIREPEYGHKLARLTEALRAEPNRPLALAFGSSRTQVGFHPELLFQPDASDDGHPLVFNFGCSGCGPLEELLYCRRLLALGIRPRCLVIELLPAFLALPIDTAHSSYRRTQFLTTEELVLASSYSVRPRRLWADWANSRAIPSSFNRYLLSDHFLPSWLPGKRVDDPNNHPHRLGWVMLRDHLPPDIKLPLTAEVKRHYAPLVEKLEINEFVDRAFRKLLALCKREGILCGVFLPPESSEFLGWYAPASRERLARYCRDLQAEFNVSMVDAREWVPDDDFMDGHHLLTPGADRFTLRLWHEFIQPLLTGTMSAGLSTTPSRGEH